MTTWRENADRLRKRMMADSIRAMKNAMDTLPEARRMMQIADTLPKPPPGYEGNLRFIHQDRIVSITRTDNGQGVAWIDCRGADPEFVRAYVRSTSEDMAPLAQYLKSGKPLGTKEGEMLARLLPKRDKGGRPRNHQIRGAAEVAWLFYRKLQEMNKASGIADRGLSDDMKLYAARAMVTTSVT